MFLIIADLFTSLFSCKLIFVHVWRITKLLFLKFFNKKVPERAKNQIEDTVKRNSMFHRSQLWHQEQNKNNNIFQSSNKLIHLQVYGLCSSILGIIWKWTLFTHAITCCRCNKRILHIQLNPAISIKISIKVILCVLLVILFDRLSYC